MPGSVYLQASMFVLGFPSMPKLFTMMYVTEKLSTASLGTAIFCFHLNVKEFESANL